jgi:DNA topoisomerase-6 subunit A
MKKSSPEAVPGEADKKTVALIDSIAARVRADIEAGKLPDIKLPVRSLDNVTYDKAKGYFELGDAEKDRTLTVTTARSFAQTLA